MPQGRRNPPPDKTAIRRIASGRGGLSRVLKLIGEGLPVTERTRDLGRRVSRARELVDGRTVNLLPKRVRGKLPGGVGPKVSVFGFFVNVLAELSEGESTGKALTDAGRSSGAGAMGGYIGGWACGPICAFVAGHIYSQRFGEFDQYREGFARWERETPGYQELEARVQETGTHLTCDQMRNAGFAEQYIATSGCEE